MKKKFEFLKTIDYFCPLSIRLVLKLNPQKQIKMKKYLAIVIIAAMTTMNAYGQYDDKWTLNSRSWTTNYFTAVLFDVAAFILEEVTSPSSDDDSLWVDRVIPLSDLVFPVGMGKKGFDSPYDIYGPYHRAFSNPFKHIGDYGIGIDASYKPCFVGIYAGAYFKSQEIVWKETKDNLRGFYFQPRAGIILGSDDHSLEAGVFYDVVTGCGGSVADTNKDRLKGGFGLDFALSSNDRKDKHKTLLQFSMPLHNFLNSNYDGQNGMKRKVGYIMLTRRIIL